MAELINLFVDIGDSLILALLPSFPVLVLPAESSSRGTTKKVLNLHCLLAVDVSLHLCSAGDGTLCRWQVPPSWPDAAGVPVPRADIEEGRAWKGLGRKWPHVTDFGLS